MRKKFLFVSMIGVLIMACNFLIPSSQRQHRKPLLYRPLKHLPAPVRILPPSLKSWAVQLAKKTQILPVLPFRFR